MTTAFQDPTSILLRIILYLLTGQFAKKQLMVSQIVDLSIHRRINSLIAHF